METGPMFLMVIVIVAVIVFINRYNSQRSTLKRIFKKFPYSKIPNVKNGEVVKITGRVVYAGEKLRAPLSGRKCSYYYVAVNERTGRGRNFGRPIDRTLSIPISIEEEVIGELFIKNGDDYIKVETDKIESYLVLDKNYSSGTFYNATLPLKKFLKKHNHKSEGILGLNIPLNYSEGVLDEGEAIVLIGKARWKNVGEEDWKIPSGKYLEITSTENTPVYLSDDPDLVYEKRRPLRSNTIKKNVPKL